MSTKKGLREKREEEPKRPRRKDTDLLLGRQSLIPRTLRGMPLPEETL